MRTKRTEKDERGKSDDRVVHGIYDEAAIDLKEGLMLDTRALGLTGTYQETVS